MAVAAVARAVAGECGKSPAPRTNSNNKRRMTALLHNFVGDGVHDAADPYAMTGKGSVAPCAPCRPG